jgi:hypothetical protein
MLNLDPQIRLQLVEEEVLRERLAPIPASERSNVMALRFGAARVRYVNEMRKINATLLRPCGDENVVPVRLVVVSDRSAYRSADLDLGDGPDAAA